MNYKEARKYIDEIQKYGSVPGLDNIRTLLEYLKRPQDRLTFIHVAGTNGKGSVIAYLSGILQAAGYKTGKFISPALFIYREIIQVNDRHIDEDAFARHMTAIKEAVGCMTADGNNHPTPYEVETAAAFLYFAEQQCEFVLLETGLGGLQDATNVVEQTVVEVFTSISRDHMMILGETLEEIAAHKAGILKKGSIAVSAPQKAEAAKVLAECCSRKKVELFTVKDDSIKITEQSWEKQSFVYRELEGLQIQMAGLHQIENACLAIEACLALRKQGTPIADEQIRAGLGNAQWKGRFTVIDQEPLFVIDGAHNEEAARRLRETAEICFQGRRVVFLLGIFQDKEYDRILEITAGLAAKIITIDMPENKRLMRADILKAAAERYHDDVQASVSVRDAVETALDDAGQNDVIMAFGSLSTLDEISRQLRAVKAGE